MKGISIIIILSVVWSIVSAVIEKRKAAQKKAPKPQATVKSQPKEVWKADPVQVKVERLRRKKPIVTPTPPVAPPPVVPQQVLKKLKDVKENDDQSSLIRPLHVTSCTLQPLKSAKRVDNIPSKQLAQILKDGRNLRTAIVLCEVLGPPLAHRVR